MKKIINCIILFGLLLAFLPVAAQNTASVSGNWNNCATWGNPPSIFQNITDTKTINDGVTVTQNTTWSTGGVDLNGTGGVNFASSANAVILDTDNGPDQSCCTVVTPTTSSVTQPTCSNGKVGQIIFNTQSNVQYSINNGTSYQTSNIFSNLIPGTYILKVRGTLDTTCLSSTINVVLNDPGTCCVAPAITTQPVNGTTTGVSNYTFTVVATGTGLSYQWKRNGITIPGATSNSYTTNIVGSYTVVITGTCGTVTSAARTLTNPCAVGSIATYTASAPSHTNPNGSSSSYSATNSGTNTDAVTWTATQFTFRCNGTYIVEGDVTMNGNIVPAGDPTSVRLAGYEYVTTTKGTTHFSKTVTITDAPHTTYFWQFVSLGSTMDFSIVNGKITKIN